VQRLLSLIAGRRHHQHDKDISVDDITIVVRDDETLGQARQHTEAQLAVGLVAARGDSDAARTAVREADAERTRRRARRAEPKRAAGIKSAPRRARRAERAAPMAAPSPSAPRVAPGAIRR